MLEPSSYLPNHCDVLVALLMSTDDQGFMPMHVINVTDEDQNLKWGMNIGTLFNQVEVDSEVVDYEKQSEESALVCKYPCGVIGFGRESFLSVFYPLFLPNFNLVSSLQLANGRVMRPPKHDPANHAS